MKTNWVVKLENNKLKIFNNLGDLIKTVPKIKSKQQALEYLAKYIDNPTLEPVDLFVGQEAYEVYSA